MVINSKKYLIKIFFIFLFLMTGLLIIFSSAKGSVSLYSILETHYSSSGTLGASCQICHSNGFETLNAYGRDVCLIDDDNESRILAVNNLDSDGDGNSNYIEIIAGAQPGWTEGDNRLYYSDTCADALFNVNVPASIPEPYDPQFNFFIYLPFISKNSN